MLTIAEFGAIGLYCGLALPRVYLERPVTAWLKAVVLAVGSYYVLHAYRFILFFTTLSFA